MSKNKSLGFQFETSINNCFSKNFDKHSAKAAARADTANAEQKFPSWKVCSFSSKNRLVSCAYTFSKFLKEYYGDIKQVKDIKPIHCQEWIDHCAKSGCSINTLDLYKSNLTKLSKIVNHNFGLHTDFTATVKSDLVQDKTTAKEFALTPDEIEKIKASITKPCNSSNYFLFTVHCATRVNSVEKICCRDLHFSKSNAFSVIIDIKNDKGSRDRTIEVQDKEFYKLCRSLVSGKNCNDLLFGGIKKESANRWLNRRMHKLNITVPLDKSIGNKRILKSGFHSVRKASIREYYQKQYNHYIKQGFSETESKKLAEGDSCIRLGHSRDRKDVISHYLRDI